MCKNMNFIKYFCVFFHMLFSLILVYSVFIDTLVCFNYYYDKYKRKDLYGNLKCHSVKIMYNFIWGHIYLYCWENNIDFAEVFNVVRENESKLYQNICKNYKPLFHYSSDKSNITDKLAGSTLELDINILTSHFNIPIEQIFTPLNYHKRLINLLKSLSINATEESEIYYDNDTLEFRVGLTLDDGGRFELSKYFDFETLTFKYIFSLDLYDTNLFWPLRLENHAKIGFFNLINTFSLSKIYLYDGDDEIIANYFNRSMQYNTFVKYKYDIKFFNEDKDKIKHITPTEEIISESYLNDYKIIDFKNIIVRESVRKCDKEKHHTEIINGIFFILSYKTGEIQLKIVPLIYCKECDTYFIYDYEYNSMKMEGKPLCRIYDRLHNEGDNNAFNHLNTESIFKICGYSVDANEDISDQARHTLLEFLINRNIVTVIQTLNFLQWLINSRKNNPNMYHAIKKWENDFSYIEKKYNSSENVIII